MCGRSNEAILKRVASALWGWRDRGLELAAELVPLMVAVNRVVPAQDAQSRGDRGSGRAASLRACAPGRAPPRAAGRDQRRLGDTTTALTTERDTKRGQLGTQRQQLNGLIDALVLGTIDPAAIAERVNDLKRSTDLLHAQVAGLESRIAEAKPVQLTDEQLRSYIEGLRTVLTTRPLDERRAFLQAWIRGITATGKTIEIEYTIPGYTGSEGAPPSGAAGSSRNGNGAAAGVKQIRRVLASPGIGAPGANRTRDQRLRRPLLYPTELRERVIP